MQEEFLHAIETLDMSLNEVQLTELMNRMDTDGDGQIDYKELCEGRRLQTEKDRANDPRWTTRRKRDPDLAEED